MLENSIRKPGEAQDKVRVLAINDLSGHSHTSLMAIIPILNAMGLGVTALPTAILSSNTEQQGFQMVDLTTYLDGFLQQWVDLKLQFNCIYSGFLSSEQQIDIVLKALKLFGTHKSFIVIDPVMADDGVLYPCFGPSIVTSMQSLVKHANMITPNLTEASLLLDESYNPSSDFRQVKHWCKRLAEMGPNLVIITNVPVGRVNKQTSVICYDQQRNLFHRSLCRFLPIAYPGTGDIFACVLTGLLLQGMAVFPALNKTVRFISRAMQITLEYGTPEGEGIVLEKALKYLPSTRPGSR